MFILDNRKWTASYVKDKNGKVWTQAAQTLWEFVGLRLLAMTLAMHCARPRTEANCHCDVSFERPLITSRPRARSYVASPADVLRRASRVRSYASLERKLWWKKFKIKRLASGCDEIWPSRNIEGKDKLSTDPLTAILTGFDHFYGNYGALSWNDRLQSHQPFHFSHC